MKRAKYKVGTLVAFGPEDSAAYGTVEAIITDKTGHDYRISSMKDRSVPEDEVLCAYRPITSATRKSQVKRKPKSTTATEATVN